MEFRAEFGMLVLVGMIGGFARFIFAVGTSLDYVSPSNGVFCKLFRRIVVPRLPVIISVQTKSDKSKLEGVGGVWTEKEKFFFLLNKSVDLITRTIVHGGCH